MKSFAEKNALITGGSSGIGLALAVKLANLGANIWLLGRDPQKLEKAYDQILHKPPELSTFFRSLRAATDPASLGTA